MKTPMELNKETAFRLWTAQFGKTAKATDFSGREIAKAAYNDRNSKFGWNVDHICPQSRGGRTADYNLICCHIQTNDEKADKFPCFVSNGTRFEIQKRQNHYEIIPKDSRAAGDRQEDELNLFDAAQGMKFWKSCRKKPREIFAGYVRINLGPRIVEDPFLPQFYGFLREVFDTPLIFCNTSSGEISGFCTLSYSSDREIAVLIPELPTKQDTEELLDRCVLLNTYAEFFRTKYQRKIEICCGMKCCDSALQISGKLLSELFNSPVQHGYPLVIDDLIRINTSAHKELAGAPVQEFYPYDIIFSRLDRDLQRYL